MIRSRIRAEAAGVFIAMLTAACGGVAPSGSWTTGPTIAPSAPASSSGTPETASPATPVPSSEVDFSILNFNIEYGGVQVDFDRIIEAIEATDADVVALEEAEGNTQRVAEALGWPFYSVRSQLVSKLPLIDPPGADGDYELVEIQPGQVAAIVNVHLPSDPYGPYLLRDGEPEDVVLAVERSTRVAALQPRLDAVAALVAAGVPTFVLGDFNSPSHLDWTAATVGTLPQIKAPLAWPVSVAMEAAGYRDVYREVYPDPVTDPGLTWWAGRPIVDDYPDRADPQDRIDRTYVAGPARVISAVLVGEVGGPGVEISTDPWGSDHRAVLATVRISPGEPPPFVAVGQRRVTVGTPVAVRYRADPAPGRRIVLLPDGESGTPILEVELDDSSQDGVLELATEAFAPGDYEIRLLAAGEVVSATPVHLAAAGAAPIVDVADPILALSAPIVVDIYGAPGARWDWLGVYARGGDPAVDDYLLYAYTGSIVSGSATIDEAGEGPWPLEPGEYDVILLHDDGFTELARAPVTIAP